MKKTLLDKQLKFWKVYGILSPLVFVVGFIVAYWLQWINLNNWMVVSGVILSATAVCWWWWTMFTISKLNSTLTKNVDHFLELLSIVKELNHDIKETSSSRRKRAKPSDDQSKSTKK